MSDFSKVLCEAAFDEDEHSITVKLTLADLAWFDEIDDCKLIGLTWIDDNCPEIQALLKRVANLDRVKTHITNRKPALW